MVVPSRLDSLSRGAAVQPRRSLHAHILVVAVIAAVSGCATVRDLFSRDRVEYQEDAAAYYVSPYPAIPWDDIRSKLEPKFELTADQALAKAVVATQSMVSQFLSMLSAAIGLSLPQSSRTSTTTVDADGKPTTTGTSQRGPGSVPPAPASVPAVGASDLAPSFTASGLVGVDSSLLYLAGTSLYQQVQLYNAYLSKGHYPDGYRGHLVTLQVNLQPFRRNLPYDAYIDISVQPGDFGGFLRKKGSDEPINFRKSPAIVLPLLMTDNLETAAVSRSVETIRQAGLQLGALVHNFGIRADAGSASDDLKSVQAFDKNSLLTLGRVNESTLRVRLGAAQQGTSRYAMVPRTHNVSFVVFVPKQAESIFIVTRTTLRDSEYGTVLESRRGRSDLGEEVFKTLKNYGFKLKKTCAPSGGGGELEQHLDFLRYLDMSQYEAVFHCLDVYKPLAFNQEQSLRRLMSSLMEIQTTSRYSKFSVALNPVDRSASE